MFGGTGESEGGNLGIALTVAFNYRLLAKEMLRKPQLFRDLLTFPMFVFTQHFQSFFCFLFADL